MPTLNEGTLDVYADHPARPVSDKSRGADQTQDRINQILPEVLTVYSAKRARAHRDGPCADIDVEPSYSCGPKRIGVTGPVTTESCVQGNDAAASVSPGVSNAWTMPSVRGLICCRRHRTPVGSRSMATT